MTIMAKAKVTSKGQITLPKQIRETLNIKTGDEVLFAKSREGAVEMLVINKEASDLFGQFKVKDNTSLATMDKAAEKHLKEKYAKSGRN
jgi:AbrB family looped-hinge helix DNA binding protein